MPYFTNLADIRVRCLHFQAIKNRKSVNQNIVTLNAIIRNYYMVTKTFLQTMLFWQVNVIRLIERLRSNRKIFARLLGKMAAALVRFRTRYFLWKYFYFERTATRFFNSFGLENNLVKRLRNLRIEKPTEIQEKVRFIPVQFNRGLPK